jgi:hypothetical protein
MRDSFGHMLLRVHIRALALCVASLANARLPASIVALGFAPNNL